MEKKKKILVFDSGVGGISILHHLLKRYPQLEITFLSDDVKYPYGTKQDAELLHRVPEVLKKFLSTHIVDLVVIACNTASTVCLPVLREDLSIPVVGVVPAIKPAAEYSHSGTIGLLATPATIGRKYTHDLIKRFAKKCNVILSGSTALVEEAEKKMRGEAVDEQVISIEIRKLLDKDEDKNMDHLVLGCTHFPLLASEISAYTKPIGIQLVDSGEAIAKRVATLLKLQSETVILPSKYQKLLTSSLEI